MQAFRHTRHSIASAAVHLRKAHGPVVVHRYNPMLSNLEEFLQVFKKMWKDVAPLGHPLLDEWIRDHAFFLILNMQCRCFKCIDAFNMFGYCHSNIAKKNIYFSKETWDFYLANAHPTAFGDHSHLGFDDADLYGKHGKSYTRHTIDDFWALKAATLLALAQMLSVNDVRYGIILCTVLQR